MKAVSTWMMCRVAKHHFHAHVGVEKWYDRLLADDYHQDQMMFQTRHSGLHGLDDGNGDVGSSLERHGNDGPVPRLEK